MALAPTCMFGAHLPYIATTKYYFIDHLQEFFIIMCRLNTDAGAKKAMRAGMRN